MAIIGRRRLRHQATLTVVRISTNRQWCHPHRDAFVVRARYIWQYKLTTLVTWQTLLCTAVRNNEERDTARFLVASQNRGTLDLSDHHRLKFICSIMSSLLLSPTTNIMQPSPNLMMY